MPPALDNVSFMCLTMFLKIWFEPTFIIIGFCVTRKAVAWGYTVKKVLLKISQNSQENACARVSIFLQALACIFIKKETLAHALSCEFWEIFKNTFSYLTPPDDWFFTRAGLPHISFIALNRLGFLAVNFWWVVKVTFV